MDRNSTQNMLLPNQPSLVQLQPNNKQPILIPKQQPLAQIHQNNLQPGIIPGQIPLTNTQQNISKQINLSNQRPLIPPNLNNIQQANKPNQTSLPLQNQNNVHSGKMPIQPPLEQINQNAQTNILNNANYKETETDLNLNQTEYYQSIVNELKESEYAEIEYSRGLNMKKVFKSIYNFHDGEIFDIYLGKGEDKKNSFRCFEVSTSFQRYCVGTSKRQFDLDLYYNISDEEPHFLNDPILKIHRIEGGCCSGRGIMTVNYANNNNLIGIITQAFLANIYDSKKQLLYRVKLTFDPEHKSCLQRFFGCCFDSKKGIVQKEKDYKTFLIKKLVEREEQVEGIIIKKPVQVIVGKMENYPLKIIFPIDASPKEKMLLIICRIFLLYMMNFSVTLREKWYETCQDIAEGVIDSQDEGILGRINQIKDFRDKIDTVEGFFDTFERAATNKNIVSLNPHLDN
jgi:hypothetical protein